MSVTSSRSTCIAFEGDRCIASGSLLGVALAVKEVIDRGEQAPVLVFDSVTSRPVELDLRGTPQDVLERVMQQQAESDSAAAAAASREGAGVEAAGVQTDTHADTQAQATPGVEPLDDNPAAPSAETGNAGGAARGRGRPKLGVVAREVTLLPRHWTWLNSQSGGASVALRKLVDAARLAGEGKDRRRDAQEAVYRFATALAGNLPGYEDATRALYADDRARFDELTASWPTDVRHHTQRLAAQAFSHAGPQ